MYIYALILDLVNSQRPDSIITAKLNFIFS